MPSRPPSNIRPSEFFESWLPAEYERVKGGLSVTPPDATISVALTGEGGGAWTLRLAGGHLTVTPAAQDSAAIAVTQSVDDWRSITLGAPEGEDMPSIASIDKMLTSPALTQLLTTVSGTLRFEVPGLHGRDFSTEVTFQGASTPSATISVDADTLNQIRAGTLPATQAFFAGKIIMTGDTAFAMQVGMAAMMPG